MRMMVIVLLALTVVLAACTAGGGTEATMPDGAPTGDSESAPALSPVTRESGDAGDPVDDTAAYPPADMGSDEAAYPAAAGLPAGYPNLTIVAPSGEVDLSELTPVAGDPTPQIAPAPGRPGLPAGAQSGLLLEAAVADLSGMAGVAAAPIEVVSVEPITWPSTALGCPEPGVAYAEVMVEGSRITLAAGSETYTYHTGDNEWVLCRDGERLSSGVVPRGG